jgi:hypothetical protein
MSARVAWRGLTVVALALACASAIGVLFGPWFRDLEAFGVHDWDTAAFYRLETVWALRQGAFPFWDPFLCGGFPAWGYAEGTPNLVSPFLPLYLALPLPLALRLEGVGATLIALGGAYGFASCHTRSVALRGLVAVLFALNGRWALQLTVGHSWHLAYAWMPVVLWAHERSLGERRPGATIAGGAALALIGYLGGIYPLPHTALALVACAAARAVAARDTRPIREAARLAALGVGFFAPKLVPILFTMARFPRWIDSTESIGVGDLVVMLTAREQGARARLVPVPAYGWHEWGIYVGWLGLAALALSLLSLATPRGRALLAPGLLLAALGFGAVASFAPWTLLHELPPFRAQHVPSRFFFPAVLLLGAAAAQGLGRLVDAPLARRPLLDLAATLVVGWLALDLAGVGARSTDRAFYLHALRAGPAAEFHHVEKPRARYSPADAWGGAALLSREEGEGVLRCAGAPEGAEPRGALAAGDPRYRGEAFLEGAAGTARVVRRAPSEIDVEVDASGPATLVVNMNHDPGWTADGRPTREVDHALAAAVGPGPRVVHFRYLPRGLWAGLALFALALTAAFVLGKPRPDACREKMGR